MTHVEAAVRFIVAALLAGVWQSPLFAGVAWSVLRSRPHANATTRHSILAAALLASIVVPVASAGVTTPFETLRTAARGATRIPARPSPYYPPKREASVPTRVPAEVAAPGSAGLLAGWFARRNLPLPKIFAFAIAALWLAGAAFGLVRLVVSLLHLEALKRDALPLAIEYRARLTRWTAATKGSREVRLCTSSDIEVPLAVGLFDALILVPNRLLAELEPPDVDSVVLHELAHLRRRDDWFNALERSALALLFFNPGIHWLAARLDLEREVACDDWVLQHNAALPYATCLAKVAESTAWPHRAMTAPGAFVTRRGMSIRIERILARQRDVRVRTSFGPAAAAVAGLAVLSLAAAFVSPSLAYGVGAPVLTVAHVVRPSAPHIAPAPRLKPIAKLSARRSSPQTVHVLPVMPGPSVSIAMSSQAAAKSESSQTPETPETPEIPQSKRAVTVDASGPAYVDELAGAGYRNLSVGELMALRALHVTAGFIRELEREGLNHPPVSDLLKLRALNVDPAYVGLMRRRFGNALDLDEIAGLRAVGVTNAYASELANAGLRAPTAEQVRELRALGVTGSYLRGLAGAGYPNLSVEEIAQLKALGIDSDAIARAGAHGLHNLTVRQLLGLRATGAL